MKPRRNLTNLNEKSKLFLQKITFPTPLRGQQVCYKTFYGMLSFIAKLVSPAGRPRGPATGFLGVCRQLRGRRSRRDGTECVTQATTAAAAGRNRGEDRSGRGGRRGWR